jgi:uncharacterized protein (TIGR03437 family)
MCREETTSRSFWLAGAVVLLAGSVATLSAQVPADAPARWRPVAGTSIDLGLASAATGPVKSVWFSGGSRLLVETAAGRVFETTDFEHWRLNASPGPVPAAASVSALAAPALAPEAGARLQPAGRRIYALGAENVFASDDSGRSWINLSGFNGRSILGDGFTALAVSPANAQEIAAANRFGVWRSLDGGLSWHGVNSGLPALPARRIVSRGTLALADNSLVTVDSGVWVVASGAEPEVTLRAKIFVQSRVTLSAAAQSGAIVYGGAADGTLLVSRDSGATWLNARRPVNSPIDRIWVDPERPDSALAASGARLLRTINGGAFWDDVTGALPSAQIHGIAADRAAGVVYLATDRGVLLANLSLNDAGPAASSWRSVSLDLPAAPAWDVRLNSDFTLDALLDGYGLFETPAPHHMRGVRLVNGADMSDRPAAPGSLISVLGAAVQQGRNGEMAFPVIAAAQLSSQLQVPFEASPGAFELALDGGADRWTVPLIVRDASPAIFVDSDGAPLLLDSESGLVLDPKLAVRAGSVVQIMATGLGRVTPDWPTGIPAPAENPPAVRGAVAAWVDGSPVEVVRATLAPGYVGYYTVELRIPAIVNRGAAELRLVMNGLESNRVKLYLEPER